MEKKIRIAGMSCENCEASIKKALLKHDSIQSASVSYKTGIAYLRGSKSISNKEINDIILPLGYELDKESFPWSYVLTLSIGLTLFILFQYLYGRFNFDPTQSNLSIGLVIGYGLVSSLHCVSMCGGLALSASLNQKNKTYFDTIIKYQMGRLISYTLTGLVLGLIGSIFQISNEFKNILLLGAGIWLVLLSLQMANLIKLPDIKWSKKLQTNTSFTIGLLNGLMGMQWLGLRLSNVKAKTVKLVSSMIVLLLGLQMIIQSPIVNNTINVVFRDVRQAPIVDGVQYVKLSITEGRYVLDYNTVKEDIPVELSFDHTQFLGCANPIILSFLNNQVVDVLKNPKPIQFTPTQDELLIHCWMNMDTITLYVNQ